MSGEKWYYFDGFKGGPLLSASPDEEYEEREQEQVVTSSPVEGELVISRKEPRIGEAVFEIGGLTYRTFLPLGRVYSPEVGEKLVEWALSVTQGPLDLHVTLRVSGVVSDCLAPLLDFPFR